MSSTPRHATPLLLTTLVAIAACTGPGPTPMDTESDTDTSTSTTSTTGPSTTSTTGPSTTSTTGSDTETTGMTTSTSDPAPVCGDGKVEGDEACDDGNQSQEDECLNDCTKAACGDGHVQAGVEICDDGVNDGAYGGCEADCSAKAPHCGDGELQLDYEDCDSDEEFVGCKSNCQRAVSCLDIKLDKDAAVSGNYMIEPEGYQELLEVYCDMDSDGGGYTFLKVSVPKDQNAADAEALCANFGLHLLIPRTEAHVNSAFTVATTNNIPPKGGSNVLASVEYMSILAIYPEVAGQTCAGMPFNSDECPEWKAADGGVYFVSSEGIQGEPSTKNCVNCSMIYDWSMDGTLLGYQATNIQGGGKSSTFLCDVGDKIP